MMLMTNATVDIWRSTYNATSGVSSAPSPVSGLSQVPVHIRDVSTELIMEGVAPGFTLILSCSTDYHIQDGDQIRGYNPWQYSVAPVIVVQHAGYKSGLILSHLQCTLKVMLPNG